MDIVEHNTNADSDLSATQTETPKKVSNLKQKSSRRSILTFSIAFWTMLLINELPFAFADIFTGGKTDANEHFAAIIFPITLVFYAAYLRGARLPSIMLLAVAPVLAGFRFTCLSVNPDDLRSLFALIFTLLAMPFLIRGVSNVIINYKPLSQKPLIDRIFCSESEIRYSILLILGSFFIGTMAGFSELIDNDFSAVTRSIETSLVLIGLLIITIYGIWVRNRFFVFFLFALFLFSGIFVSYEVINDWEDKLTLEVIEKILFITWIMLAFLLFTWRFAESTSQFYLLVPKKHRVPEHKAQFWVLLAVGVSLLATVIGAISGILGEGQFDFLKLYETEDTFTYISVIAVLALTFELYRNKSLAAFFLSIWWYIAFAGQLQEIPTSGFPAVVKALFCIFVCFIMLWGFKGSRILNKYFTSKTAQSLKKAARKARYVFWSNFSVLLLVLLYLFGTKLEWIDEPFNETATFVSLIMLVFSFVLGWTYLRSRAVTTLATFTMSIGLIAVVFSDDAFNRYTLSDMYSIGILITICIYMLIGLRGTFQYHKLLKKSTPKTPVDTNTLAKRILAITSLCFLAFVLLSLDQYFQATTNPDLRLTYHAFITSAVSLILGLLMIIGSRTAGILLAALLLAKAIVTFLFADANSLLGSSIPASITLLALVFPTLDLVHKLHLRLAALKYAQKGISFKRVFVTTLGLCALGIVFFIEGYQYYTNDLAYNRQFVSSFYSDSPCGKETGMDAFIDDSAYIQGYYTPQYFEYEETFYAFTYQHLYIKDQNTGYELVTIWLEDLQEIEIERDESFWSEANYIKASSSNDLSYVIPIPLTAIRFYYQLNSAWHWSLHSEEDYLYDDDDDEDEDYQEHDAETIKAKVAKTDDKEAPVPKEITEALSQHLAECNKGRGWNCFDLARIYKTHKDNPKYLKEAAKYYKMACDLNYSYACNNLGVMYLEGTGVDKNESMARNLYVKGCDEGLLISCNNLAHMIGTGKGGYKDRAESKQMTYELCEKNNASACKNIGMEADKLSGLREIRTKAYLHFKKSCYLGNAYSCAEMAHRLRYGDGILPDKQKSLFFANHSCNLQNGYACRFAGDMLSKGDGVDKNWTLAQNNFLRSCNLKNATGCIKAGYGYEHGLGTRFSFWRADNAYLKACEEKDTTGCYRLAGLREDLATTPKMTKDAFDRHVELCLKSEISDSCYNALILSKNRTEIILENTKLNQLITQAKKLLTEECDDKGTVSCVRLAKLSTIFPIDNLDSHAANKLVADAMFFKRHIKFSANLACNAGFKAGCDKLLLLEKETRSLYREQQQAKLTKYDISCYEEEPDNCVNLGWYRFGLEEDEAAYKASDIACDNDEVIGCSNFAQYKLLIDNKQDEALPYYERTCKLGKSMGCMVYALLNYKGTDPAKDMPGEGYIDDTIESDCFERRDGEACSWVAEWYKTIGEMDNYKKYRRIANIMWDEECVNDDAAACRIQKLWKNWTNLRH